MKKIIFVGALSALLLTACGEAEKPIPESEPIEYPKLSEQKIEYPIPKETTTESSDVETSVKQQSTNMVDTSFFTYANSVEVIDNRKDQNNLLVWIDYSADAEPGMSTLNTLNQAFDFLQQSDVIKTGTVTLAIRVDDVKVAQFNVTVANVDFNNNELGVGQIVVNASEVEYLNEAVKTFGQTMELWK